MADKYAKEIEKLHIRYNISRAYPPQLSDIARALGYAVEYFTLDKDNLCLAGATYYKEKRILITPLRLVELPLFNPSMTIVAHELGHIILGHDNNIDNDKKIELDPASNIMHPDPNVLSPRKYEAECEAGEFAMELLIPAEKVMEIWKESKGDEGIDDVTSFFGITRDIAKKRLESILL